MKPVANTKILVVDDDVALAVCVAQSLQDAGFSVHVVNDSPEALARITATIDGYDVLISDNSMPKLMGGELIDQVRKAGFQGKVLVCSGSVSSEEEQQFKALGADVVLRKPFELKMLVPTIMHLCGYDHDGGQAPD